MLFTKFTSLMIKEGLFFSFTEPFFPIKTIYIVYILYNYLQYVHFFMTPPPFTPGFLDPLALVGASYLMPLSLSSNVLAVAGLGSTGFS